MAGDSAGGGLAMALCHYLIRSRQTASVRNHCHVAVDGSDGKRGVLRYQLREGSPVWKDQGQPDLQSGLCRETHDPMDEYISPMFGDFRGFPPMLIQVGSYEMLLSDSVDVAAKARGQGVKVRLSIYDGMFHIFQMAAKMLPESRKAWVEIGKFIEILLRE